MTDMDDLKISGGLKRLRLLRLSLLGIVITFPLVVYLMTMFDVAESTVITVGISWVAVGIILEFIIGFSRCPACGKHFHVKGMSGNFFTKKCLNCGIPLTTRVGHRSSDL